MFGDARLNSPVSDPLRVPTLIPRRTPGSGPPIQSWVAAPASSSLPIMPLRPDWFPGRIRDCGTVSGVSRPGDRATTNGGGVTVSRPVTQRFHKTQPSEPSVLSPKWATSNSPGCSEASPGLATTRDASPLRATGSYRIGWLTRTLASLGQFTRIASESRRSHATEAAVMPAPARVIELVANFERHIHQ